jgi:hypothetical protein
MNVVEIWSVPTCQRFVIGHDGSADKSAHSKEALLVLQLSIQHHVADLETHVQFD